MNELDNELFNVLKDDFMKLKFLKCKIIKKLQSLSLLSWAQFIVSDLKLHMQYFKLNYQETATQEEERIRDMFGTKSRC